MTIPYPMPTPFTEDPGGNIVLVTNRLPRPSAWRYLDWGVSADGYRLVIENGVMIGLAYDEWPYPWGDERYEHYETLWRSAGY